MDINYFSNIEYFFIFQNYFLHNHTHLKFLLFTIYGGDFLFSLVYRGVTKKQKGYTMNQKMILTITGLLIVGATSLVANSNIAVKDVKTEHYSNRTDITNSTLGATVDVDNGRGSVRGVSSTTSTYRADIIDSTLGTSVSIENGRANVENITTNIRIKKSDVKHSKIETRVSIK